jgi:hypothetical protein
MRKGFLIYEEMQKYLVVYMGRRLRLVIYDFGPNPLRIIFFSFLTVFTQAGGPV